MLAYFLQIDYFPAQPNDIYDGEQLLCTLPIKHTCTPHNKKKYRLDHAVEHTEAPLARTPVAIIFVILTVTAAEIFFRLNTPVRL